MGNDCSHFLDPPTPHEDFTEEERCNNTTLLSRRYCARHQASQNQLNRYCAQLTSIDEFSGRRATGDEGNICHTDTIEDGREWDQPSGCCGAHCAVFTGGRVACDRANYYGERLNCCLRDMEGCGNNNIKLCFDSHGTTRTCHPDYRDMRSPKCDDLMYQYCTGKIFLKGQKSWKDPWIKGEKINTSYSLEDKRYDVQQPCLTAVMLHISGGELGCNPVNDMLAFRPNEANIDVEGYTWARDVVGEMLKNYEREYGTPVGGVGSAGRLPSTRYGRSKTSHLEANVSAMDDTVKEICSNMPGLCQDFLKKVCARATSEDLSRNPAYAEWCGCYMRDSEYDKYINLLQVNKECTPFCANAHIPLVSDDTITIKRCQDSLCIMDDLVIRSANSSGTVTFNQICGSCGGGFTRTTGRSALEDTDVVGSTRVYDAISTVHSNAISGAQSSITEQCKCVMLDTTINLINSQVKGIDLSSNCGSSTCYKTVIINEEPQLFPYPCSSNTLDDNDNVQVRQDKAKINQSYTFERKTIPGEKIAFYVVIAIIISAFLFVLSKFTFKKEVSKFPPKEKPVTKNPEKPGSKSIMETKL